LAAVIVFLNNYNIVMDLINSKTEDGKIRVARAFSSYPNLIKEGEYSSNLNCFISSVKK
jgi:hypothetical protein